MPFNLASAPFRRLLGTVLLCVAAGAAFAQVPGFDSDVPEPGDRTVIDEKSLQETLQDAVENGEDIDEYRHGGTRLHHALRAGLQNTALWLLAHGADPALQVHDLPSEQPDGNDALQLAIVYHRWRIVDALLHRPGLVPRNAADLAFRWSALSSAYADVAELDDAARELSRRLAWPRGWQGDCLNAWARSRVVLPMLAKATTAGRPAHAARPTTLKGRDAVLFARLCQNSGEVTFAGPPDDARRLGRLAKLSPTELARIDARSSEPLLPALATLIETEADARIWSSLPLRRPWPDPGFARAVVQALLATPMRPDAQDAALRTLPRDALRGALDDDVTLHVWFERLAHLPPADFLAALGAIDDATLARHADAAITGLASKPRNFAGLQRHGAGTRTPDAAAWVALLSRLPEPLALRPHLPVLALAPDAAWPVLFERGFVPTASQIAQAWYASTPEQWRVRWPMLRRIAGEAAASQALGQVLAAWTAPCEQDGCAPQPEEADKLRIALDSGGRLPPPVTLSPGAARLAKPNVLRELTATHLVAAPPSAVVPVPPPDVAPTRPFERLPFDCAAAPDPLIVRAVLHHAFVVSGNATAAASGDSAVPRPDTLQPVAEPGARGCAWLVSGGSSSVKGSTDEDDFYTGHFHMHSCSEVTLYGELWRVVDGQLVASSVDGGAGEGALTLASGARRFLLTLPIHGGGCDHGRPGALYEWIGDAANRRPMQVPDDGPTRTAFDQQCHLEDPAPCFGLPATGDALALAEGAPDAPLDRDAFVERYGGAARQRWIDAFLAGDFATPRAGELADAMPVWRLQALAALTASTLPLEQRRQRIAWLFRDAAAMTQSFGPSAGKRPEVLGLVAWLPREDWRPMLKAIGSDDSFIEALHDAAKARGDVRLACVFTKARGFDCPDADRR